MSLAVIVPWGTDHGQRARIWTRLRAEWEATGLDLIEAADPLHGAPACAPYGFPRADGPVPTHAFSVARAVNRAVRLAPAEYDRFVLWGADHLPDPGAIAWTADLMARHGLDWAFPYDSSLMLDPHWTDRYLAGELVPWHDFPRTVDTIMPGLMLVTRAAWERVGGFDERYEGWGYEDVDLMNRLSRDVHPYRAEFYAGPLRGLWHSNGTHAHRGDTTDANPNTRLFRSTWG